MKQNDPVVDAINDLTRVTIALSGEFKTQSEAVRRLNDLAIPPNRIANILAMEQRNVSSALAKQKKRKVNEASENK